MTPIDPIPVSHRRYALISPCRNEAAYLRRTLDSVLAQSAPPALWIIVDDGSTDDTPRILAEYAARHPVIRVVGKPDRGHRAVGAGVVRRRKGSGVVVRLVVCSVAFFQAEDGIRDTDS